MEIIRGNGFQSQNFLGKYEAQVEFREGREGGGRVQTKKNSHGMGMDIFYNNTLLLFFALKVL